MDPKELRITALSMKIDQLQKDKKQLIELLHKQHELIIESYSRDQICPHCKRISAEIEY